MVVYHHRTLPYVVYKNLYHAVQLHPGLPEQITKGIKKWHTLNLLTIWEENVRYLKLIFAVASRVQQYCEVLVPVPSVTHLSSI